MIPNRQIVVNFNTRKAISLIHYVVLRRVTAIEVFCITDLCESKLSVDPKDVKEIQLPTSIN